MNLYGRSSQDEHGNYEDDDANFHQVLMTRTHLDHVYTYSGQSYGPEIADILHALSELAHKKSLELQVRQIAFRDVKIMLPTHIPIHFEQADRHKRGFSSNTLRSLNRSNLHGNFDAHSHSANPEDEDDFLIFGTSHFALPPRFLPDTENLDLETFLNR